MALQETPEMADWMKTVDEVLISHGTRNPCKVVQHMQESGEDKAPIFRKLVEACEQWKALERHLKDLRSDLESQRSVRATESRLLDGVRAQGLGPLQNFEEALADRPSAEEVVLCAAFNKASDENPDIYADFDVDFDQAVAEIAAEEVQATAQEIIDAAYKCIFWAFR
jgi:hypothetical protein